MMKGSEGMTIYISLPQPIQCCYYFWYCYFQFLWVLSYWKYGHILGFKSFRHLS